MSKFDISSLLEGVHYVNNPTHEDRVVYDIRQKIVKTGEGEHDFVIEDEVYEKERVSTDAYIQSFKDDAGLENLLHRYALTGDKNVFNVSRPVFGDTRGLPENNMQYDDAIAAAKDIAKKENIPFTQEGLEAYVQKKIDEALAAKKGKEGD